MRGCAKARRAFSARPTTRDLRALRARAQPAAAATRRDGLAAIFGWIDQ
ncbi:hypothetical protein C4K39_5980 [Pseudomonas sessilinigenes]|nr:hypothetical protein C4K39_5980 [Pseudomonas sessilinigenes]